jgi:hypothetical protein
MGFMGLGVWLLEGFMIIRIRTKMMTERHAVSFEAAFVRGLLGIIPGNMDVQQGASSVEGSAEPDAEPWT